ncbi:MAG TPA: hypothetical protein VMU42_01080, partial [Candidatus Sulfotelmatobacter sp.]|nr:hypothetical protein [Candidatus Sulfotelmatobacter sp.]
IEALATLTVFLLLTGSALFGRFIRRRLPEDHRTRETIEAMQIIIGMLVTFTALVLGLLTASVKAAYDHAGHDLQEYALDLTQLDRCLRNYGPETEAARDNIRSYTAALIASTWTSEPPPTGVRYPNMSDVPQVGPSNVLGDALNRAYLEIRRLAPANAFQAGVRADCAADFQTVLNGRKAAIEDDRLQISRPFDVILVVWLMIIFAVFGLVAPRNIVSLLGIVLVSISLSLAMFVIAGLSRPYFVAFPSDDMRAALAAMMAPAP